MATTSLIKVSSCPESSVTKVLCFGCFVPNDILQGVSQTFNDDNDGFDNPLKNQDLCQQQPLLLPLPHAGVIENTVGIVGTVTLLGRSTALVWMGWGRLREQYYQDASAIPTKRDLGAAENLSMGPLMVSMPRKSYQGAFASDIPSSKLIGVSDLESDLMASQMSERISQRLQMAILVSCYFDDAYAPNNTAIGLGTRSDVDHYVLRRRAMTIAEKEICKLIEEHLLQT